LTEKKFRPASAFTLFCVKVQMLHHHQSYRNLNSWLLSLCKCLCHRLQDVVLSVCLLRWTHTLLKC